MNKIHLFDLFYLWKWVSHFRLITFPENLRKHLPLGLRYLTKLTIIEM